MATKLSSPTQGSPKTGTTTARTVLIVESDPHSLRVGLRSLSGQSFSWAYLGRDVTRFQRVQEAFRGRGDYLDTADRFHEASQALRDPYLAYIHKIGRGLNTLGWWLTSVSHRSSYASDVFLHSCYLRVAADLATGWEGETPLVLVVDDITVRGALKLNLRRVGGITVRSVGRHRTFPFRRVVDAVNMLAHRAFIGLKEARRMAQARKMIRAPYIPAEETILLMSWANAGNLRWEQDFHRSFFGDLVNGLKESGYTVAVAPMVTSDVSYRKALTQLRNSVWPMMMPHRYLTYPDLLSVIASSCRRPLVPRSLPELEGMDIGPLLREELRTHWVGNQIVGSLLMGAYVRRWALLRARITRIIYTYENQPWERALCWESRRSLPGTALVGYQYSRVPRLLLNCYLAEGEQAEAPLPDLVVTVGEHTARLLREGGYDPNRVRTGGALQMQDLLALRSRAAESSGSQKDAPVLVAAGNGFEETVELLRAAAGLFDRAADIPVIVKCHPIMPFDRVKPTVGELPKNVTVSDEPIEDLMLKSSAMVYTGSTICVQALALGLPVVHLRSRFELDMDPLEAVPHLRLEATGQDELNSQVAWLLEHREEYVAEHHEAWDRLVGEMYGPVTPETFRAFVDQPAEVKA